ncbi:hypothetical protein D9613_007103 [Agrocybe pediades]|uniref:C2H2-type domain-containing protein n=1 Tax=Agrocybe pediades TaxID=84607 RepID=A0A8H4QH55_9AGAR|nr:hypothetical protein D9613_007103 [Agrocybe pediades]
MDIHSVKRARAPSDSSSLSTDSNSIHPSKSSRTIPSSTISESELLPGTAAPSNPPLLCSLPPTCHRQPTPLANTNELEKHYAKFHAHVCEYERCGCVFTDARLLELHQTECHDPIAALRKDRGEKIFQCHIPAPTCGRNFLTPKARRLHLIQAHGYPKEYFFAVTNKGIGGLLRKWGEGASMIRKEWKPRENKGDDKGKYRDDRMDEDNDDEDEDEAEEEEEESDSNEQEDEVGKDYVDLEATPRLLPRTTGIYSPNSSVSSSKTHRHQRDAMSPDSNATSLDALANSMESLTLVPDSVRFGKGGKKAGFAPNPHRGAHRGMARGRGGRGGIIPVNAQHTGVSATGQAQQGASGHSEHGDAQVRGGGRGRGIHRPPRVRGRGRGRGFLQGA